jgi:hypothetical protein
MPDKEEKGNPPPRSVHGALAVHPEAPPPARPDVPTGLATANYADAARARAAEHAGLPAFG